MKQRISPCWEPGRHPNRPRLLLEDATGGLGDADCRTFESAGFEVALCTGPDNGDACPLLERGQCQLAEEADVVLFSMGSADERRRRILRALRRRFPATPVVVQIPAGDPAPARGLPGGCRALAFPATVEGQIWAARKALEAPRRRIPVEDRAAETTSR